MALSSCVKPDGTFAFAIHKPHYQVTNLRVAGEISNLGLIADKQINNSPNFPPETVEVRQSDWVYEIANPLPFRGATFINGRWATANATNPANISLPAPPDTSFCQAIQQTGTQDPATVLRAMPETVLLALATTSTDPHDLTILAEMAGEFCRDHKGKITGLIYQGELSAPKAKISNHALFEAVANNPALPEEYQQAMVLRPGAQGNSEIIGESFCQESASHVFEYLRRNSYIPWGHYAANMANDTIRYSLAQLSQQDMSAMRHLYYQRTYQRLAADLELPGLPEKQQASPEELERCRQTICASLANGKQPTYTATLWGWNYGFDLAPTGYRLNASHQMIHQQYAMIPAEIDGKPCFACGDMIADFCTRYQKEYNQPFFTTYFMAINNNNRLDKQGKPSSLIIYEDDNVMAFIPKAQTSQWEVQIMTKKEVGNVLEADTACRASIDEAFYRCVKALHGLGLKMMCTIEFNKRFTDKNKDQRLLYSLLPRLPYSPGAFSETQQRWITGHFPEDFAHALRTSYSQHR